MKLDVSKIQGVKNKLFPQLIIAKELKIIIS